jgi:hypothetical protein
VSCSDFFFVYSVCVIFFFNSKDSLISFDYFLIGNFCIYSYFTFEGRLFFFYGFSSSAEFICPEFMGI